MGEGPLQAHPQDLVLDLDSSVRPVGRDTAPVARRQTHTDRPFAKELPRLLKQRGWSVRHLAEKAKISQPHLSRIISGERKGNVKPETVLAVTRTLGLPDDYFPEIRESRVISAIKGNPSLREKIYRQIAQS